MTSDTRRPASALPARVPPAARRRRAGSRRRVGAALALLAALAARRRRLRRLRARRSVRRGRPAAVRGRAGGQGALRHQLHHLPRPQRPGRAGPRPEPDRRRLGRGRVPGRAPAACRWPARRPRPSASPRSSPTTRPASSAQYIQELGGGPQLPGAARTSRAGGDIAHGGELFRVNCSSCHAFGGGGGALSSGKYAPEPGARHRPADLRGDAHRPAEHAGLR